MRLITEKNKNEIGKRLSAIYYIAVHGFGKGEETDLESMAKIIEHVHGEPVGRLLCDKYNLDGLIEQLPSAQPEVLAHGEGELSAQPERKIFSKMPDAEFEEWLYEHGICHPDIHESIPCDAVSLLIDAAINEMLPAQQWILCSERPPEESGDYLVTVAHHSGELLVEVDQFDNENGSWWHYMDDVIAWMPLPEPYKGEKS